MTRTRRARVRVVLALTMALAALLPSGTALAQLPPIPPLPPLPVQIPFLSGTSPTMANDLAHEVLTTDTVDPTRLEVTADGRVLVAERKGAVKIIRPDGTLVTAGRVPVDARSNQCSDCPGQSVDEGGLHGLALAPDFDQTGHLYLYFSVPNTKGVAPNPPKWPGAGGTQAIEGVFRLSRFTLTGETLDLASEVRLLENPAEWDQCCHYGGDLEWLPDGTLLLAVADDTNPHASNGYSPRDKRDGREAWDADRTAQNPADRRGKVLRLMPDGSVPTADKGVAPNPHVDDPAYDPYVYAMGFRSNYSIAVDASTGFTFVGNVGPDASSANPTRGPAGMDEFETIPPGGGTNHGWPHCIGENVAYHDYDWATQMSGELLSCEGMVPADIWYQPGTSSRWPELGTGGRTAIAGVVYDYQGDGPRKLPERLQGKLLLLEYSRNYLWSVPLHASGPNAGRINNEKLTTEASGLRKPIDATIGPDGALYVAEYGSGFYNNTTSRITRIVPRSSTSGQADTVSTAGAAGVGDSSTPLRAALLLGAAALLVGGVRRRRTS
jgi:aldose sugar dehydrogenase